MAKLRNTERIFELEDGASLTVGNNRVITRVNRAVFEGRLHGHKVFRIVLDMGAQTDGDCHIRLDHCGYMTRTTRDAMQDFARFWRDNRGVLCG